MSKIEFSPLQRSVAPLRHKIMTALRDAIESGALAPGVRLIERDLCERLAVSRTSLREALRALTAEGVVSPAPHRGLMVTSPSVRDVLNAEKIRAELQSLVTAEFIERASASDRLHLASLGKSLIQAYADGSLDANLEATRAFHEALYAGARDTVAGDIIAQLLLKTSNLRARLPGRPGRQPQSIAEIEAILSAISKADAANARMEASQHVFHTATSSSGSSRSGVAEPIPEPIPEPLGAVAKLAA